MWAFDLNLFLSFKNKIPNKNLTNVLNALNVLYTFSFVVLSFRTNIEWQTVSLAKTIKENKATTMTIIVLKWVKDYENSKYKSNKSKIILKILKGYVALISPEGSGNDDS